MLLARMASLMLHRGCSVAGRQVSSCTPALRSTFSRGPAPSRFGSSGIAGGGRGMGGGMGGGVRRAATGGSGDGDGKPKGLWAKYLELLETQPMMTRSVTCALLNGLGDVFCQLVVEQQELSIKRATTFTLLGLLFIGPILTVWYSSLGSMVTAPGLAGILISLGLDQFAFAPVFIASIMSVLQVVEGHPERILPKLKQDLPDAVKVNWLLWIPAQYINFKFVPPNLRVLAVNVVALVWNVYMSFQSHKAVAHEAPAPAVAAATKAVKGKAK